MFLNFLEDEGESFTVTSTIPNFKIGTTLENLKLAAQLEHERCIKIPEYGKIAESEIANFYKELVSAEQAHEARFSLLAK